MVKRRVAALAARPDGACPVGYIELKGSDPEVSPQIILVNQIVEE